jgi:hypothetical protein
MAPERLRTNSFFVPTFIKPMQVFPDIFTYIRWPLAATFPKDVIG